MNLKKESRGDHPLGVIKAVRQSGIKEVIVAYSSGKDSLAVLDLCVQFFDRVVPYFMYMIPKLEFQEVHLRYVEERYGLEIMRVPDWRLAQLMSSSFCRHPTQNALSVPRITWRDIDHYVRQKTGIHWIASGETAYESLQRRGMIVSVDGIDSARGHFYPVGYWRRQDVHSFLSQRGVVLPSEYRIMSDGRSFGGLSPTQIYDIKGAYPEDFEKIKKLFPLVETQIARRELMLESKEKASTEKKEAQAKAREEKKAERQRLKAEKMKTLFEEDAYDR